MTRKGLIAILLFAPLLAFAIVNSPKARGPNQVEDPAPKLELIHVFEIPGTEEFQKTRVGGLSGLVWDESAKMFWAVSDDRGRVNEPRIYGLELSVPAKGKSLSWKIAKLITLTDPKSDPKSKKSVWDLEGIALLPWGDFLIVSEGDMNQKPRVNSRVMAFKPTGVFMRDFEVPAEYLAPATGQQKTGPRNNFSFEGLAAHAEGQMWVVASELGLVQDAGETTRFLEYTQTQPFVLKPGREWFYPLSPLNPEKKASKETLSKTQPLITGVSEILHARGDEWWVLERGAGLSVSGISFSANLFRTELGSSQELKKNLLLDLAATDARLQRNFEAMAWGPNLPDGRRLLILMSDNNLEKKDPTVIAAFAVTWPETPKETE